MPRPLPSFATVLARRILPALLIGMALVGGSAAVILWFDVQDDLRVQHTAAAQSVADAVASELRVSQATLKGVAKAMDSLAERTGLPPDAGRDVRGMAAMMLVSTSDVVTDVVLPTANSRTSKMLIGINLSRMRGFAEARYKREPRLVADLFDERRLVMLVEPLERGALVLLVDPGVLARPTAPVNGGFVSLLDEAGMPICSSAAAPTAALQQIGRTVSPPPKQRPAALTIGDTTYYATRLGIPGTPWTAMLCSIERPAYAGFYRSLGLLSAVAIGIAAATSLAVLLLSRRAIAPLRDLPEKVTDEEVPGIQPFAELDAISQRIRHLSSQVQEKSLRLRRVSDILAYVSEGPASRPYQDFFQALAHELAAATQTCCVLITEWVAGSKPRANILAVRANSALPDDFRYELTGNPCHRLVDKPFLHIQQGASQQYPESPLLRMVGAEGYVAVGLVMGDGSIGGHIELINDQELVVEPELRDLLSAVAIRSAAELERIRASRQLQEVGRLDRELRADTSEFVLRWSPAGTITYANEAVIRWYGQGGSSLVGTSLFRLFREEDRPRLSLHVEKLEDEGLPLDMRVQLPDGSMRRLRNVVRAVRDQQARVIEYQGTATDVSAVREVETALSRSQELLELIRANAPVAIWISDWATHRCVWLSATMTVIWPLSYNELTEAPMAWTTVIHEEDRARVARSYLLYAAEGLYQEEYRIVHPNGEIRWIRDKAVPTRSSDGAALRVVNFAQDVSCLHPGTT